jgi:hypothetical protein
MPIKLDALIKRTQAEIDAETDPKKLRPLQANLAAFLATKAEMDDDDGDDDDNKDKDDDDSDDDESKSKMAAKKAEEAKRKAEASKHRAKAAEHKAKAAELEEMAKKCEEAGGEEDDDDEARLRTPAPHALTPGAAAALASQSELGAQALARVDKLEKAAEARELNAMIEEARAQRRITPGEAKTLAKKSGSFVRDFLEMRPKALVATTEDTLEQPDGKPAGDIPAHVKALVEQGVTAAGLTGEKADKYREESYSAHRKAMANGAGVY